MNIFAIPKPRAYIGQMAIVVIAAGCAPLASPTPTPTAVIFADCFIYFHLSAWEDLDGDGVRDDGEMPLEGVEMKLAGDYANSISGNTGSTDENGMLTIDIWSPGGCIGDYEITASAPNGYEATTDSTILVKEDEIITDHEFGFRIVDGE